MITRKQLIQSQELGRELLKKTGIFFKSGELNQITVVDFGLSDLKTFGAQILTLLNSEMISVKLIALHSFQILPEHWHPKVRKYSGKEEILRVEWGEMYSYSIGKSIKNPQAVIPKEKIHCFNNWHETIMKPGDQIAFPPTTPHWFQAGPQGVVVWSFSTKVLYMQDEFIDREINRETIISG